MKKLLLLLLVASTVSYSQTSTLHVDNIYDNASESIVIEKIINVDSTSTIKELKNRFNNWGGTNFLDYSKVKTLESDNRIVIDYISSSFGLLDMYVRLTASFKLGKVRIVIEDMGNVYKYQESPALPIPARTNKVKSYFYKNNQITYKVKPGYFNIKQKQATGALNYRVSLLSTVNNLYKGLLIDEVKSTDDGW